HLDDGALRVVLIGQLGFPAPLTSMFLLPLLAMFLGLIAAVVLAWDRKWWAALAATTFMLALALSAGVRFIRKFIEVLLSEPSSWNSSLSGHRTMQSWHSLRRRRRHACSACRLARCAAA